MSITFRITGLSDGLKVIDRQLEALEERARDTRPAHAAIVKVFNQITKTTFDTEGASSAAGKWAPLAKSTERDRVKEGYSPSHPILVRTADMKDSVASRTGDSVIVSTPNFLSIGSSDEKLRFHQSRRPRKKLPRRPVFEPTQDDKHALLRPLRRWLTGHDPDEAVSGRVTR